MPHLQCFFDVDLEGQVWGGFPWNGETSSVVQLNLCQLTLGHVDHLMALTHCPCERNCLRPSSVQFLRLIGVLMLSTSNSSRGRHMSSDPCACKTVCWGLLFGGCWVGAPRKQLDCPGSKAMCTYATTWRLWNNLWCECSQRPCVPSPKYFGSTTWQPPEKVWLVKNTRKDRQACKWMANAELCQENNLLFVQHDMLISRATQANRQTGETNIIEKQR